MRGNFIFKIIDFPLYLYKYIIYKKCQRVPYKFKFVDVFRDRFYLFFPRQILIRQSGLR